MGVSKAELIIRILLCDAGGGSGSSGSVSKWAQREINYDDLNNIGADTSGNTFFFLNSEDLLTNLNLRQDFSKKLRIPDWFWTPNYQRMNGGFRCEDDFDEAGNVPSRRSWVRFLVKIVDSEMDFRNNPMYVWYEMAFFTLYENGRTTMLCIDTPDFFAARLFNTLDTGMTSTLDEFWSFNFILYELTQLYNENVWSIGNVIRDVEKERDQAERGAISTTDANPWHINKVRPHIGPDFSMLHELARHAIHSSETLQVAIDNITQIIREHDLYYQLPSMLHDDPLRKAVSQLRQKLDFRLQYLQSVKVRSDAISARVHNEINLAFNMVSQRESQAAIRDSAVMRTIATVTLTFLPAICVSAVFSTSFFDFSPSNRSGGPSDGASSASAPPNKSSTWVMSDQFWIYWAIAIPLTAATVLVWYIWQRWSALPDRSARGVRGRGAGASASANSSSGHLERKRRKISFSGSRLFATRTDMANVSGMDGDVENTR